MILRFYTSVEKQLTLKLTKFWGLIFTVAEVGGKKPVGGLLTIFPLSVIGLRFNSNFTNIGI